MNKLFYIANIRLPTEKAHGIQIMKMCEAFADIGQEVELIVPKRKNDIKSDPFEYYSIKKNFKITVLPTIDLIRFGWLGFWIQSLIFSESVAWYVMQKKGIFYTRDALPAFFVRMMGKKVIWEGHRGENNLLIRFLIKFRVKMVMITHALKNLYIRLGMQKENIFVAPDAVDAETFSIPLTKDEAREKCGFEKNKKIILYTGHLYGWKGADTLAEAAKLLSDAVQVCFVGGTEVDIVRFKEKYATISNIVILGKKPHQDMPFYMKSADILVIPNSDKEEISSLYTSPMKLFEYMASGRPIIASDLPSLREVIDESIASFFTSDDPASLAQCIKNVLDNYLDAEKKGFKAALTVREYTWKKRAKKIIEFVK